MRVPSAHPCGTNIISGSTNHKASQAQNRHSGRQSNPGLAQNSGHILQREGH